MPDVNHDTWDHAGIPGIPVPDELPAWLSATFDPRDYPASPAAQDDEFDDSSGHSGATNGLNGRWSWRNQGSAAATFGKAGWLTLSCPAASSNNYRIVEQAEPSGDYTIEARISFEASRIHYSQAGIILLDSAGGDFYTFHLAWEFPSSVTSLRVQVQRWTNVTTWAANVVSDGIDHVMTGIYLRVVKIGTTFEFWISTDGIGWQRLATTTDAVGVDRIGLGVNESTSSTGLVKLHCDYFRRVA